MVMGEFEAGHLRAGDHSFSPDLPQAAERLLARIYRPGYQFRKVGVMLLDLSEAHTVQRGLVASEERFAEKTRLQQAIDPLNCQYGCDTVGTARQGFAGRHRIPAERKSRCFTMRWEELHRV